ncbi:MAG TPA: hypothetical protein VEG61_02145 [Candidatus Dormibacteraeota bacterium]|nr:hypothetical protein [Candidatus Dormibacteraeota bacterium]
MPQRLELGRRIIDEAVDWVTANEVWLTNVLPDSVVVILFVVLAAYFALPQYAL